MQIGAVQSKLVSLNKYHFCSFRMLGKVSGASDRKLFMITHVFLCRLKLFEMVNVKISKATDAQCSLRYTALEDINVWHM